MIDSTEQQFLVAVLRLSGASAPFGIETVASAAGLTPTQAALAVIRLGHAGLIDSNRLRLTMHGLVTAVQLDVGRKSIELPERDKATGARLNVWQSHSGLLLRDHIAAKDVL